MLTLLPRLPTSGSCMIVPLCSTSLSPKLVLFQGMYARGQSTPHIVSNAWCVSSHATLSSLFVQVSSSAFKSFLSGQRREELFDGHLGAFNGNLAWMDHYGYPPFHTLA